MLCACEKDDTPLPIDHTPLYFPEIGSTNWDTESPVELGWNRNKLNELEEYLEESYTRAFLILKNGKIAYEVYFGTDLLGQPFDAQSSWYWASAGKSLIGFLAGQSITDGYLQLDSASSNYLGRGWTALTPEQEEKITVRHQLTMTSGLDERPSNGCTEPQCLTYKAEPGTRWAYHNGPYTLTHQLIENASDQPFSEYFNSRLRDVIGMDGNWQYLGENHVYFSTARAMARFGLLILNRGIWDAEIVLDNDTYFDEMINSSQEINPSYGYLWWLNGKSSHRLPGLQLKFNGSLVPNGPSDMLIAAGKNGQLLNIVPHQNLIIVRMGDNPDNSLVPTNYLNDLWLQLNAVLES